MNDAQFHAPTVADIDDPRVLVTGRLRLLRGADLSISAFVMTVAVVGFPGLGWALTNTGIAELPLVHGDPYTMMGPAPSISFARSQRLDRPFEPTHIVGFTIDGTRANRSDLTIDDTSTATANANEVITLICSRPISSRIGRIFDPRHLMLDLETPKVA